MFSFFYKEKLEWIKGDFIPETININESASNAIPSIFQTYKLLQKDHEQFTLVVCGQNNATKNNEYCNCDINLSLHPISKKT